MFDIDRWQEIWHTLAKNPLRTLLTALGVGWGVLMLVVMLGAGDGLENGVRRDFGNRVTNSFSVWARSTTLPYKGLPANRSFEMSLSDVPAIKQQIPEVDVVAPSVQRNGYRGGAQVVRGVESMAASVRGDLPDYIKIEPLILVTGRFLNPLDIDDRRKVAVVGTRIQEVLFEPEEDPIGQYIRIDGVYFQIVGVFTTDATGNDAERQAERIHIPITTFQQAFNTGDVVHWMAISSKTNVPASVAEEKTLRLLRARHRVSPNDERAFGHWNMEKRFSQITGLFAGIRMLVWVVGIGTLLAGIIGVTNIMLIVVRERTQEIGVRRALGAKPWNIISQVITESVVLTAMAGYAGLITGVAIVELLAQNLEADMFYQPGVELNIAVTALVILIFAGGLGGLLPAIRAVQIKPVEALRYE